MNYEKEIQKIKKRLAKWGNVTLLLSLAVLLLSLKSLLEELLK